MKKQPGGLFVALFPLVFVSPCSQLYPRFLLITFRFDLYRNARRSLTAGA